MLITISLFGDLDIAGAEDLELVNGTYGTIVSNFFVAGTKKDEKKLGLNIIYTVTSGPKKKLTHYEWMRVPSSDELKSADVEISDKAKKAMSRIKKRLADLGVPESRMNDVQPDDVIGTEIILELAYGKGDYADQLQVRSVKRGRIDSPDDTPATGLNFGGL